MDWTEAKYLTPQICKITGTKQPKIRQWILNGMYEPDKPGRGAGYPGYHSLKNALEIAILQRLADMSLSLRVAKRLTDDFLLLMDIMDNDYQRALRGKNSWQFCSSDGKHTAHTMKGTEDWKDCIGINLKPIIDEIAERAKDLE